MVGASPRPGSTGCTVPAKLAELDFDGPVFLVNPRYREIGGETCYPSLADLPGPVDLAVLAVANARVERQLELAIDAGAGAASIFGSCLIDEDETPRLAVRLAAMAREAGLPVNGANCMGYCNFEAAIRVNSYPYPGREPGGIAFLSHSGSVFSAITMSSARLGLNLTVSCGNELSTTVADYMDYALALESTRVIGLFLEAIRDGEGFVAALRRAAARRVPVVVLKTGRTETASRMALSHSGALTGDDRVCDALFRRHGVLRTDTLDELVASMLLMEHARDIGPGGLASIHDSGGEREMVVDLAAERGVPFAAIGPRTRRRLRERLDFGLEPENPCDSFGTGKDHPGVMRDCLAALMADEATGLGLFFLDADQRLAYSRACAAACVEVAATTSKPVALATNYSGVNHRELAIELARRGLPVLDGTAPALKAVAGAFAWRDWRAAASCAPPGGTAGEAAARWRRRLVRGGPLDEDEALSLLDAYGIAVSPRALATGPEEAVAAARALGFPVALKTAMPGTHHKTEAGGVKLGLAGAQAVADAWRALDAALGPRVLVAPMAGRGVDLMLGMVADPQFGAVVVVGAGGVLVELLRDRAMLLAPAPRHEVEGVLGALRVSALLDGVRGRPRLDREAAVDAVVALSRLAAELGDLIAELDVNPLRVLPAGALALDALVVPRAARYAAASSPSAALSSTSAAEFMQ